MKEQLRPGVEKSQEVRQEGRKNTTPTPKKRRMATEYPIEVLQYCDDWLLYEYDDPMIKEGIAELNRRKEQLEKLKREKVGRCRISPELTEEIMGTCRLARTKLEARDVTEEDAQFFQEAYLRAQRQFSGPDTQQQREVQEMVEAIRKQVQMANEIEEQLEKIEIEKKRYPKLKSNNNDLHFKQQVQKGLIRVLCRIGPFKKKQCIEEPNHNPKHKNTKYEQPKNEKPKYEQPKKEKAQQLLNKKKEEEKPNIKAKKEQDERCCMKIGETNQLQVCKWRKHYDESTIIKESAIYNFDLIFGQGATQAEVFQEFILMINAAFNGKKLCIFTYGQTGSGKTHTIIGNPNDEGVAIRTIRWIYNLISQQEQEEQGWSYVVRMGAEELSIHGRKDLLANAFIKGKQKATIRVRNQQEAISFVRYCAKIRSTKPTQNNPSSSRSHFLITIDMEGTKEGEAKRNGSICISDLAGCQRYGTTNITKQGSSLSPSPSTQDDKQTQYINSQLSNLQTLIISMVENTKYVPRENTLPAVLMEYLGRETLTMTILTVSPNKQQADVTKNSVIFAAKLRDVRK